MNNDSICYVAIAALLVSLIAFVVLLCRIFPWNTKEAVGEMLKAAAEQPDSKHIDREEAVYHVMKSRQLLGGWFLAFAALLFICSTILLVTIAGPSDLGGKKAPASEGTNSLVVDATVNLRVDATNCATVAGNVGNAVSTNATPATAAANPRTNTATPKP